MSDLDVKPVPPRKRTCERDYCTAYRHDHYDSTHEGRTCVGCGKPTHYDSVLEDLQHDDGSSCDKVTAREWPEIVVHTFPSTGTAYNMTQTCEDIRDGDVLHVPNERVVGVLVQAWPCSITAKCGEFHGLKVSEGQALYQAWAALDGGKYAHSYLAAAELLVIDMHEVVRILIDDHNVVAYVEHTGGGCMTIYAGEPQDDEDGDPRYPALGGPGTWPGPGQHAIGNAADFYVGPDDQGETLVVSVAELGATSEREVAELVVRQVRGENVNPQR